MTRLLRHDIGELEPPRKVGGRVIADARIARTGIQLYTLPDGTVRREYRPPEEVFKADTLGSALLAPVTIDHPSIGLLSESTAREHQRGAVGEARRDGMFMRAPLGITDAEAAKAAASTHRQISCGYECRVDETPGVTPEGEHYDAVQRDIVINHVALVEAGRAGPAVRVRMDSESAMMAPLATAPANLETKTMKIKIDGAEHEIPESAAPAVQALIARADAAERSAKEAQARADATQARMDAAQSPKALENARAEMRREVRARLDLEQRATKFLTLDEAAQLKIGDKLVKLDAATDRDIRVAVLDSFGVKVDGRSDEYIAARADIEMERAPQTAVDTARASGGSGPPAVRVDADAEIAKLQAAQHDMWKPKPTA